MSVERVVRVSVDHGACIGSGICVGAHPDLFRFEGARAVPVAEDVVLGPEVRAAVSACPMEAIRVHGGDRPLAP